MTDNCLDEEIVAGLIAGLLGPEKLARIEPHLAICAACREVIADAGHGVMARTLPVPTASEPTSRPLLVDRAPRGAEIRTGQVLASRYRVETFLGSGGMGEVFSAVHVELGHRVAIKVLRSSDPSAGLRFLREAQTCARLSTSHVVQAFDLERLESGAPFIVMELLEGEDMAHVIARGPVPTPKAVSYVAQACVGLAQAHEMGIVHRDLKPANLFVVTGLDGHARVKVLDFGISKLSAGASLDGVASLTQTGAVVGSPLYMSPEQIQGRKDVDLRTDIWSLGVVLYELLTGRRPFYGHTMTAIAVAIATEAPARPSSICPGVPMALDAVVLRCLEKNPAARFPSASALIDALTPFATLDALDVRHLEPVAYGSALALEDSGVDLLPQSARMGESVGPLAGSRRTFERTSRRRWAAAIVLAAVGVALFEGRIALRRPPPLPSITLDPSTWEKAGRDPNSYTWVKDERVLHGGMPTMRLEQNAAASSGTDHDLWAEAGAWLAARRSRGFRVRLKADVKTENAATGAALWLRLDAAPGESITLCNMMDPKDLRLKGTNDFAPLSCVLDVPEKTKTLAFGFMLTGSGTAWIGPATLEAVGRDVPESPHVGFGPAEPGEL